MRDALRVWLKDVPNPPNLIRVVPAKGRQQVGLMLAPTASAVGFFMPIEGDRIPAVDRKPPIPSVKTSLTVAGSDSGGGAGIQADLKTFASLGVYGTSAVTAVTAQNTREVVAIAEVPEEVVGAQIDAVLEDIGAHSVKTGMLSSAAIISVVVDRLQAWGVEKLVVDPVMVSKGGNHLLQPAAVGSLRRELLPIALIVTPNLPEASVLAAREIESDRDIEDAARAIGSLGVAFVVVKGGHRQGEPIDTIFDGSVITQLPAERVATENTHGTGCTFSAAVAAYLALGHAPMEAIALAKVYISSALRASYPIGGGHSPVNHFFGIHERLVEPA